MTVETIEREEWLLALMIMADIRHELRRLNRYVQGGEDDGEEEEDDADA